MHTYVKFETLIEHLYNKTLIMEQMERILIPKNVVASFWKMKFWYISNPKENIRANIILAFHIFRYFIKIYINLMCILNKIDIVRYGLKMRL